MIGIVPPSGKSGQTHDRRSEDRLRPVRRSLLFGDLNNFAATILSAILANAVGQFLSSAIGAEAMRGARQGVVGPLFMSAGFGMASFRIGHDVPMFSTLTVDPGGRPNGDQ